MDCNKEHDEKNAHKPFDCAFDEFTTEFSQCTDVSVPVKIDPDVCVGRIQTKLCGDPIVVCTHEHCDDTCKIMITQRLCVRIPLTFTAMTCVEDPIIKCCTGESCCR